MESSLKKTNEVRRKRTMRVRKHLRGTAEKPRLCIVKTAAHIHVQLIDDEAMRTIASVSTNGKEFKTTEFNKKSKLSAEKLGTKIAELAKKKKVATCVCDRGPFKYHGVIATLADAARAAGLKF